MYILIKCKWYFAYRGSCAIPPVTAKISYPMKLTLMCASLSKWHNRWSMHGMLNNVHNFLVNPGLSPLSWWLPFNDLSCGFQAQQIIAPIMIVWARKINSSRFKKYDHPMVRGVLIYFLLTIDKKVCLYIFIFDSWRFLLTSQIRFCCLK